MGDNLGPNGLCPARRGGKTCGGLARTGLSLEKELLLRHLKR
jgi:hypothetical protein